MHEKKSSVRHGTVMLAFILVHACLFSLIMLSPLFSEGFPFFLTVRTLSPLPFFWMLSPHLANLSPAVQQLLD